MQNKSKSGDHQFCWWREPWWNSPEYVDPYSSKEVAEAVDYLKLILTEQWMAESFDKCPGHYFHSKLLGPKGGWIADFIVRLARMMKSLQGANGFKKKLKDLQTDKHMSVYFELSMAEMFAMEGSKIEFPKEGKSKVPDIVVDARGERFSIECKRLEEEQWQRWESELLQQLSILQIENNEDTHAIEIQLNERLSELRLEDKFDDINAQLIINFERAINTALNKIKLMQVDEWLSIPGIGRIRRVKKTQGIFSQITGFAISPVSKLRRIIRNGFLEAIEQLPTCIPGVAAIYSFHPIDADLAKIVFSAICEARPEKTSHVVALLICSGGTVFKKFPSVLLVNQKSHFDTQNIEALKILKNSLNVDVR